MTGWEVCQQATQGANGGWGYFQAGEKGTLTSRSGAPYSQPEDRQ